MKKINIYKCMDNVEEGIRALLKGIADVFRAERPWNWYIIAAFVFINGTVLYNALAHYPWAGYDAPDHIRFFVLLSRLRLPGPGDGMVSYMPPFSYLMPAYVYSFHIFPFHTVLKMAQFFNFLYSLGLTICLLKICQLARPGNSLLKILTLFFLGMMPVYYKTFAFIRSEPLLAFLTVYAIYKVIEITVRKRYSTINQVQLGITLGFMLLTRKTCIFTFLVIFLFGLILFLFERPDRKLIFKMFLKVFLMAYIIGGWFHLRSYFSTGTVATYNVRVKRSGFFSNQPPDFYFGLGNGKLFSDPFRDSFPNQFLPTFYTEFWGDYLYYYLVYGKNIHTDDIAWGLFLHRMLQENPGNPELETNRWTIQPYLARVNIVGLFPSFFMLVGVFLSFFYLIRFLFKRDYGPDGAYAIYSLSSLVVVVTMLGFMWFLISYPSTFKGDNIKTTYILAMLPFVALLSAEFLVRINKDFAGVFTVIVILLLMTTIHNFGAFVTKYTPDHNFRDSGLTKYVQK